MTIHKRTERKQEIVERTIIDGVECDLCKRMFPTKVEHNYYCNGTDGQIPDVSYDGEVDWRREGFDVNRTHIIREEGNNYPEGPSYTRMFWTICPKCFDGKLIPWLKEQGAEPTVEEID